MNIGGAVVAMLTGMLAQQRAMERMWSHREGRGERSVLRPRPQGKRYMPHQGERERARRRRQIAAGHLRLADG